LDNEEDIYTINQEYGGERIGPYLVIKLSSTIRFMLRDNYRAALEILGTKESEHAYRVLINDLVGKVELTALCRGGDRLARWTLDTINPEYGEEECYNVASKLLFYILSILEADLTRKGLDEYLETINNAKNICMERFNEQEVNFLTNIIPPRTCPLCLREIELIDFFRNGRTDSNSIVFGHYEYRGARSGEVHIGKNAFWVHRDCNSIQGVYTIEDVLPVLREIIRRQEEFNIDWEDRG